MVASRGCRRAVGGVACALAAVIIVRGAHRAWMPGHTRARLLLLPVVGEGP